MPTISDAVVVAAEGRNLRAILVLYARPTVALAVAPALSARIRTVRDLKGRSVGVSAPGSTSHQLLNFSARRERPVARDDVSTVGVGMSARSVAALEHGTVDAAVFVASAIPLFEGRQHRCRAVSTAAFTANGNEIRPPERSRRLTWRG
jgi:NitT/TauT family transport system substrate-binding protein